jgi:ribonucleotide monophosphatase NagD (HAD superfamily)
MWTVSWRSATAIPPRKRVADRQGARFIATNPDRPCPLEGGVPPDCADVIAALEATNLKKVEVIVGKPSPIIVQVALEVMGWEPRNASSSATGWRRTSVRGGSRG